MGIFLGTTMTSRDAIMGLPGGEVTRARSVARLIPSEKWRPEAILKITGTPARPNASGIDDCVLEEFANPHLLMDAEQRQAADADEPSAVDMPLCLHSDRRLPNLRITQQDLSKYGYTDECPRCVHTKMGVVSHINSNHWDSCRRRIYRRMYQEGDPKLMRWLRDHPLDTAKVGPSLELPQPCHRYIFFANSPCP